MGCWQFSVQGRQISQMPNGEIVCDMEQYKHELEQIDVSKADKPSRSVSWTQRSIPNSEEVLGVWAGLWIIAVHSYHSSWQNCDGNRRHRQFKICWNSTKWSAQRRWLRAKSRSEVVLWNILVSWEFMMRLMQILKEVHHELSCSCVCAELAEQEDQEGCPQQFGCRDMQYVDLPRTSRLDAHDVGTDDSWWICAWELRTDSHGASEYSCHRLQKPVRRNTQRRSSSSVNRQEIGNWAGHSQGSSSVRWNWPEVDWCEISNRRLPDETRLKKVRGSPTKNSAGSTGTNANKSDRIGTVTVLPLTKNCGLRSNDQIAKMGCRQEIFRSVNLDVRTMVPPTLWHTRWWRCNTLLYLRTVFTTTVYHVRWSGFGDSYSLGKRDGICGMDWGQTYCEHWKCVNRRLPCCRESGVIA